LERLGNEQAVCVGYHRVGKPGRQIADTNNGVPNHAAGTVLYDARDAARLQRSGRGKKKPPPTKPKADTAPGVPRHGRYFDRSLCVLSIAAPRRDTRVARESGSPLLAERSVLQFARPLDQGVSTKLV